MAQWPPPPYASAQAQQIFIKIRPCALVSKFHLSRGFIGKKLLFRFVETSCQKIHVPKMLS